MSPENQCLEDVFPIKIVQGCSCMRLYELLALMVVLTAKHCSKPVGAHLDSG